MLKLTVVVVLLGFTLSEGACPTGTSPLPTVLGSRWPCASINTTPVTFFAAEEACQQQYGHLIPIPNMNVNTMLAALLGAADPADKFWIGISNLAGGQWLNVDNANRLTYYSWAAQQPPNHVGSDGILIDQSGLWYADYGTATYNFICGVPEVGAKDTKEAKN